MEQFSTDRKNDKRTYIYIGGRTYKTPKGGEKNAKEKKTSIDMGNKHFKCCWRGIHDVCFFKTGNYGRGGSIIYSRAF
jgi:hypothetical protein